MKKLLLLFATSLVFAGPIRFELTYIPAEGKGGTGSATGFIVFEETLLPNPGAGDFLLPDPAVLDLEITVTGASSGNGTFTLADFCAVVWDTNGGTLDLSTQLIGQPTSDEPWGSTNEGAGGDFNLFTDCDTDFNNYSAARTFRGSPAPTGVWWFTLGANGGSADEMVLSAMSRGATIPTMSEYGLAAFIALLVLSGALIIRRKRLA